MKIWNCNFKTNLNCEVSFSLKKIMLLEKDWRVIFASAKMIIIVARLTFLSGAITIWRFGDWLVDDNLRRSKTDIELKHYLIGEIIIGYYMFVFLVTLSWRITSILSRNLVFAITLMTRFVVTLKLFLTCENETKKCLGASLLTACPENCRERENEKCYESE